MEIFMIAALFIGVTLFVKLISIILVFISNFIHTKKIDKIRYGTYELQLINAITKHVQRHGSKDFVFEICAEINLIDTKKVIKYINMVSTFKIKDIEVVEVSKFFGNRTHKVFKYVILFDNTLSLN